jgi:hypothetical protein
MSEQIIQIRIPKNRIMPDIVSFSAEENYLMIKIGSECIKEGRKAVTILTQNEIYEKLKNESRKDVERLEMELLVERKTKNDIGVEIKKMYEYKINECQEKIEDLKMQLLNNDSYNIIKFQKELQNEKEKFEIMYKEKEKQVEKLTNIYEKLSKQNEVKSSKKLGDEGEENFMLLSETFRDFNGYKLEKKSHQSHKGDFHLFFEKFNVLVDLKNYTGSVQKKEVEKIEHDLTINDTMDFAWLISYESNICDWNKYPIMFKWIITDIGLKCIVMVNKFNLNGNSSETLRTLWNMTNELYIIMNKTKDIDNTELQRLHERDYHILQKIKISQKRLSEMKRNIASMSQINKDIENDMIEALSMFTNELTQNKIDKNLKIQEWWENNVVVCDNENIITSTSLWSKFKKDNKLYIEENKMTVDGFKDCIKNFIDATNYTEKSKNGMIEFIGFKIKNMLVENKNENENENEKMEVELNIVNIVKNKKTIKKDTPKIVVSLEKDKEVIVQYTSSNDDIMQISLDKQVKTWQVVSILVTNKILGKRSEARGYDKYKETEEYLLKINK